MFRNAPAARVSEDSSLILSWFDEIAGLDQVRHEPFLPNRSLADLKIQKQWPEGTEGRLKTATHRLHLVPDSYVHRQRRKLEEDDAG